MTRPNGRSRSQQPASLAGRHNPVTFEGVHYQDVASAARAYGQNPKTVTARMVRDHLPLGEALTKEVKHHATRVEMEERRAALLAIVRSMQPMTVRQAFYQATVARPPLVEKTEHGYRQVQVDLVQMRRSGELPYGWIIDNTRERKIPYTCHSIADALQDTVDQYRKALWDGLPAYVEIWTEKDTGLEAVTNKYDVALMVAHGFASETFLNETAERYSDKDVPIFVYHIGDHDPSGVSAAETIEEGLKRLAPDADITFERLAVLPWQIKAWKLPTRPTKQTDSRAAGFKGKSVELDAIAPDHLRGLVEEAILRHMTTKRFNKLLATEKRERAQIAALVERLQ
jgi:hypothetical protein